MAHDLNKTEVKLGVFEKTTIAALATGNGTAAIALIRLSGSNAKKIALESCQSLTQKPFQTFKHRFAHYVYIIDPKTQSVIDDVVLTYFASPHSYTGEDLVEISCHGGPYIVQQILRIMYELGACAAEPGEFTKRAYLNGKMDLTKAEGIRELIEAQSSSQWYAARQLASGKLADEMNALRKILIEAMAYLEAQIDFPDEGDTAHLDLSFVHTRVTEVRRRCERLLASYRSGHISAFGPKVVICGLPNAGKSTLLNILLGKERAIVTDVAGTTRDYIEEGCLVNGRYIRLVDTAGIRHSLDRVESIGIEQARTLVRNADLAVLLVSADQDPDSWRDLAKEIAACACEKLYVLNKADVGVPDFAKDWIKISALNGTGVADLKAHIAGFVDQHAKVIEGDVFITSERHHHAMKLAVEGLAKFDDLYAAGGVECLAFELQEVVRALKIIVGHVEHDEVLDKIFSEFCVGK